MCAQPICQSAMNMLARARHPNQESSQQQRFDFQCRVNTRGLANDKPLCHGLYTPQVMFICKDCQQNWYFGKSLSVECNQEARQACSASQLGTPFSPMPLKFRSRPICEAKVSVWQRPRKTEILVVGSNSFCGALIFQN